MELPNQPLKTAFNRLSTDEPSQDYDDNNNNRFSHPKLLSGCSRTITCEKDMVSPGSSRYSWNSPNPFNNLKIEIENNNALTSHKRRSDDSCLDDTYETPFKKLCRPNDFVSPDLACVLDSYNLPDVATVYSTTDPQNVPCTVDNTVKVQSEPTKKADSRRCVAAPRSSPSSDTTDAWTTSISHENDEVTMDLRPVFDFDVDDLMCLSPFDSDRGSDDDFEAVADKGLTKSLLAYNATQDQVTKGGNKGQEGNGEAIVGEREQDKDKLSQQEKEGGVRRRGCEALQRSYVGLGEGQPLCSGFPKPSGGLAMVSQLCQSFTQEDVCYGLFGAPLVPEVGAEDALEGAAGEGWHIGAPILESSVCHGDALEVNATCEGNALKLGEKGGLDTEEVTVETSYETTMPLNVQVRSVVVVPSVEQCTRKPSVHPTTLPEHKTVYGPNAVKNTAVQPQQNSIKKGSVQKVTKPVQASSTSSDRKAKTICTQQIVPRPVVFDKEEDWQREKRLYVSSVTRHMRENSGAGVMTELVNLMNHVADQGPGTNSRQWQHPSDLTRRNYQKRFGNDSTIYTLDQWQNRNYKNHRRFAKVPRTFERSPVL
ncbi:uncharacterized protein LOC105015825 [Esox lucius]|uniref:S100P-binding protein n=1 Tax=Esox lucius TaxID=8010 RepID=A0A3P8XC53_ESOLU|nr:uncharacterized protein LOC105015825 [Esox lucius]XP_010877557.2 uncharacterized protein LOC105015825 [Esox lucius]XP_010877558.2 uncharacterized protein LOC105015825 [Esox lucius]